MPKLKKPQTTEPTEQTLSGSSVPSPDPSKALKELQEKYGADIALNAEKKDNWYQKKKRTEEEKLARENFVRGLKPGVSYFAEFLAKRMPNPIPPTKEELDFISDAFTAVAVKRFEMLKDWSEEGTLFLAVILFMAPRSQRVKTKDDKATKGDVHNGEDGKREKHFSPEHSEKLVEENSH